MELAYPISLPITVLILVIGGSGALIHFEPVWWITFPAMLVMLSMLAFTGRAMSWHARFDALGVRVSSPFDNRYRSGEVAWVDVRRVHASRRPSRRTSGGCNQDLLLATRTRVVRLPVCDMQAGQVAYLLDHIRQKVRPGAMAVDRVDIHRMLFDDRLALLKLKPA
ncbi:MAG: hypothetical protein EON95_05925 [Caulobacteraceae bacterium]|nr:MAG: hypothetical protein EON95_05925 [Caulobacteraceae bacterium]